MTKYIYTYMFHLLEQRYILSHSDNLCIYLNFFFIKAAVTLLLSFNCL